MVRVFISCRFSEALKTAEMLKTALVDEGISCFLCSVHAGDSIGEAVIKNLRDAELVVILGTKTYGKETESRFSTFHELHYILDKKKSFFLIKMCDHYEESFADFYFTSAIANYPWPEKDHHTLPSDLVPQIMQKLKKISDLPSAMERAKIKTPAEQQLGRRLVEQQADLSASDQIVKNPANSKVAEEGLRIVKDTTISKSLPTFAGAASTTKPNFGHLLFFSYAQNCAGEALLLSQHASAKFPGRSIFRDVDFKFRLNQLVQHVKQSKNLVVLLSENYIRRPFTLVELHAALQVKANIVAVRVTRPGLNPFDFGQVQNDIASGNIYNYLDESGWDLLKEYDIDVEAVATDLKTVMNVPAISLDILAPRSIIHAMMDDILSGVLL